MAKKTTKPAPRTKARAPARPKPAAARKAAAPAAKTRPAAKAASPTKTAAARKPAAKKAPAKAAAKPAATPAAKKPAAKPARPVAVALAKPATPPGKAAPASRSTRSPVEKSTTFVTTSKPETHRTARKTRGTAPPENGVTMQDGRYALPTTVTIDLPNGYRPLAKEEYMSPRQLQYFRNKLSRWREELVEESRQTIESLRDEVRDVGDEAERATRETENSLELRTRDRYRKLIAKIDKALKRIEEGRYGFCEETDEEIGIERLEARPIATLSLDAQERWEHRQKQMGD
jgi:RNA polymerase-binding transcription factor